ncbi:hypothetical protein [Nocardia sp. MW-W600-9]
MTFPREVLDYEYFLPGALKIRGADSQLLTGRARWEALTADHNMLDVHVGLDSQARDQVAAVCSPYRRVGADTRREVTHRFGVPKSEFPDVNFMAGVAVLNCVQCPPNWGGLLAVAVASHAGLVDAPNPAATEPSLDERTRQRLIEFLTGTRTLPPDFLARLPLDGADLSDIGSAWGYTSTGLCEISLMHEAQHRTLLVVGDSAEDFALARLWQLIYGHGVWLPSPLRGDPDAMPTALVDALAKIFYLSRYRPAMVTVTSASMPAAQVDSELERFRAGVRGWPNGDQNPAEISEALTAQDLPWPRRATKQLAVTEQFDDPLNIPVEVDATGTRTMLTPLPPPLLENKQVASQNDITWHVDITWLDDRSVEGGDMTTGELLAPEDGLPVTLVRSGRHGPSYPSKRYDLVLGGIPTLNRLPRPKLRDLSLSDWVDAKLAQHDLTSRLSPAGHRAAQLTRMFGSRDAVVDLFAGPLLPALRKMDAKQESSTACYPNDEGVRIRAHYGVLNFSGFHNLSADAAETDVRHRLDAALQAGVIRRGLVLQCALCTELQFQPVDRLGQRWTCERCDTGNELNQPAWKLPLQEPRWYYDLHPVGRQLLGDHGDVPIALAAYLSHEKSSLGPYQDLTEVELVGNRKARVELDLVAYQGGIRTIAEAKSAAQLSGKNVDQRRAEVSKKCQAAVWLEADELVFATSTPEWTSGAEADILRATQAFDWPDIGPPTIRLIAGLDPQGTVTSKTLPRPGPNRS